MSLYGLSLRLGLAVYLSVSLYVRMYVSVWLPACLPVRPPARSQFIQLSVMTNSSNIKSLELVCSKKGGSKQLGTKLEDNSYVGTYVRGTY